MHPVLMFAVSWFPIKNGIVPVFFGAFFTNMEAVNAVRCRVFRVSTGLV